MTEVNEDQIDEYIEAYLADENRDGPGKNSFKKLSHVLVVWNTQQHLQKRIKAGYWVWLHTLDYLL